MVIEQNSRMKECIERNHVFWHRLCQVTPTIGIIKSMNRSIYLFGHLTPNSSLKNIMSIQGEKVY